jgi:hypothetical protein
MIVTNYQNDALVAGNIKQLHSQVAQEDQPSVCWSECPDGTKVVRARFLADRIDRYSVIVDHSYTLVRWPNGSYHYLNDSPWSGSNTFRRVCHLKRWIYKVVKADGRFFPGLFDAINVMC